MNIQTLLGIRNELINISKENLKLRTAFNIAKFISTTEKDAKFFQDRVVELIKKYGARDADGSFIMENDGTSVQIDPLYIAQCESELSEINNYEIDVPELKIFYSDLPEGLSVTTLFNIMDYIVEE